MAGSPRFPGLILFCASRGNASVCACVQLLHAMTVLAATAGTVKPYAKEVPKGAWQDKRRKSRKAQQHTNNCACPAKHLDCCPASKISALPKFYEAGCRRCAGARSKPGCRQSAMGKMESEVGARKGVAGMLLVLSAFYVAIIAGYAERVHFIDQCLPAKSQNARGLCNVAAGCFQ